jgi:hypothetical protein
MGLGGAEMTEQKPFHPGRAQDVIPASAEGDFLTPVCIPGAELLMGEKMVIVVLKTMDNQRIGIPMVMQTVSDLHALLGEVLRQMQAPEGGPVQ